MIYQIVILIDKLYNRKLRKVGRMRELSRGDGSLSSHTSQSSEVEMDAVAGGDFEVMGQQGVQPI